jgi:hypothetical protein
MSDNKINNTAAAVINRIIGDAAFMFIDSVGANARPALETWQPLGVALSFSGDISGEFTFWAPPALARGFATNMLGVDSSESISPEKEKDALKEIVNIIVGNFLTEMFGTGVEATLGLPCLIDRTVLASDYGDPDALWLTVENEPIVCVMRIDGKRKGKNDPEGARHD